MSVGWEETLLRLAVAVVFSIATVVVYLYLVTGHPGATRPVFYYLLMAVLATAAWRWAVVWAAFTPQEELDRIGWTGYVTAVSGLSSLILGVAVTIVPAARLKKRCDTSKSSKTVR